MFLTSWGYKNNYSELLVFDPGRVIESHVEFGIRWTEGCHRNTAVTALHLLVAYKTLIERNTCHALLPVTAGVKATLETEISGDKE